MTQTATRNLILGFLAILGLALVIFIALRQAPSADEGLATVEEEKQFTSVTPSTIWGTVKYSDGTIASGVTVTIGGIGQTTNSKGEYAASVYQTGALPVQFESGKDVLLSTDAAQAEVDVTEGTSIRRDFVIQKVPK